MRAIVGAAAVALVLAVAILPRYARTPPPFGFARESASAQHDLERRFMALPDAGRIRESHRELTRTPHPAGSPRDRELADWTAQRFRDAGMTDVAITTHDVLLSQPLEIVVEAVRPHRWRATLREPALPGDPDTRLSDADAGTPYHAYSASADMTAPVVYAGNGVDSDYEWLASRGIDVRGRIVLVRQSGPYSYRGFKAFTAERRGAAGILMFADAPAGHAAPQQDLIDPDTRIERGAIVYDFFAPGDPLTPGWPSTSGAKRLPRQEATALPRIASVPLSAKDARTLLQALDGPAVPASWLAEPEAIRRAGPGPVTVHMRVRMKEEIRPVWTVTGVFRGRGSPDDVVIVGNHRDAWVYGGVDPSSGSAALIELARTVGELRRSGWQPERTLLFASWDAEEFALISSTEWAEQHAAWLRDRAVAYVNVDSAASGSHFVAAAAPSIARLVAEAAQAVRDPGTGTPVAAVTRERRAGERRPAPAAPEDDVIDSRPGGGSDYTVFLNHLGIPSADLAFDGPVAVAHSTYDTHAWVDRIGDPGFKYHAALVQLWGIVALRLAQADAVPLDVEASARQIVQFVQEIERRIPQPDHQKLGRHARLPDIRAAARALLDAAEKFERTRAAALEARDGAALARVNRQLITFERTFLDDAGLPGRPWYRHLVNAPTFSYEPEVLPGLAEAIEAGDGPRLAAQTDRLVEALRRAAFHLVVP